MLMGINWWAVLTATALSFVLGGFWYGFLFVKPWLAAMGIEMEDIKDASISKGSAYVISLVASAVLCVVMAIFVNVADLRTPGTGALLGALAWLGFNFTSFVKLLFWEDRPAKLVAIDGGYDVLCFVGAGALLAFWR